MITKWVKVSSGVWKPSTKTEWWILSLQYIIIFHYFFNEGLCKLNKWWKMTEKKWQEHVLLYHFLNDEKQSNGVYWEEKTYSTACAETWIRWVNESSLRCTDICVYLKEKKHELTFSNFLTIKKLELDFTNLFNHDKNNTEFFLETWEGKRCL